MGELEWPQRAAVLKPMIMKGTKVLTLGAALIYKHVYMSKAMDFLLLADCLDFLWACFFCLITFAFFVSDDIF